MLVDANTSHRSDRLALAAGLLLWAQLSGCTRLDVGLGPGADGPPPDTAPTTTEVDTTIGAADGSGAESSVPSSGGGATTGASTTDATTDASTTEPGTTGGGTPVQAPCDYEQEVCAEVTLDGAPVGTCGETLELKGLTQQDGEGRWLIEDCDYCERCNGPVYELTLTVHDAQWQPTALPACSRVAVDFAPDDDTPWACGFVGLAIWGDEGSGEHPAPVYMAASIITDPPAGLIGIEVTTDNVDPDLCDARSCCYEEPGDYTFTWSGTSLSRPLELAENGEATGVVAFDEPYEVRNERSHSHRECDRIPHFDWIFRR